MPLYDYRCQSCGKEFEVLRRRGDETPVRCPSCDKEAEKQLSGFSVGSSGGLSGFSGSSSSNCGPTGGG